jgi:hypothetical protein
MEVFAAVEEFHGVSKWFFWIVHNGQALGNLTYYPPASLAIDKMDKNGPV